MTPERRDNYPKSVTTRGKSLTSLSRFHVAFMHGKFAAAKVSTFVVSDFCVVWDFECQRLCITPLERKKMLIKNIFLIHGTTLTCNVNYSTLHMYDCCWQNYSFCRQTSLGIMIKTTLKQRFFSENDHLSKRRRCKMLCR